jgi:uncharacterized protein YndB with AHSA1/START domain
MNDFAVPETLVIEREMPHAPEKIWRALTDGPLIAEWLMANDFQPVVGHKFSFRATPVPNWNGIIECEVVTVGHVRHGQQGDMDADAERERHTRSHGAVRLQA